MNMLARISAPEALLERPDAAKAPARVEMVLVEPAAPLPAPAIGWRRQAAPSPEAAAFTLLHREERLAILLSRRASRLAALSGTWLSAVDALLPAASPAAAAARDEAGRRAALRRYAILYRLDRGGIAVAEEARLAAAGFSEAQAETIRALVEHFDISWAPPAKAWKRVAILAAIAAGGTFLLDRWLGRGVGDPAVAWLLSIVIACGIASFLSVTAHPRGGQRYR
jgi:hypothetical protein